VCGVQPPALTARSIGVMQPAALIFKHVHATRQHFACRSKKRHVIRSIPYASKSI